MIGVVYIPRVTDSDKTRMKKRISEADENFPFRDGEELSAWLSGQREMAEEKSMEPLPDDEEDREYSYMEMKQFFAEIPVWQLDAEIEGIENKAGGASQHPGARKLRKYWTRGKGALKIRWGQSGDYNRCVKQLSKYVGVRAKGLCHVYHVAATGNRPGEGPHAG